MFSIPAAPRGFEFAGDEKRFDSGTVFWQISSPNTEFMTSLIAGLAMKRNIRIDLTQTIYSVKHKADGGEDRIGIRGIQAPFWVRGSRKLIELGWETGFGEANSQGFGMAGWGRS